MSAWSAKSRHKVPNAVGDKRERILSLQAVTPPLGGQGERPELVLKKKSQHLSSLLKEDTTSTIRDKKKRKTPKETELQQRLGVREG